MSGRYVPPHLRRAAQAAETQPKRSLSQLVKSSNEEIVLVCFKSNEKYTDFPVPLEESSDETTNQLQLNFNQRSLDKLFEWFKKISQSDIDAVLEFPPSMDKRKRRDVHTTAQRYNLGSSSQGFADKRYLSVYSEEHAKLGIGKIQLTAEEKAQADRIWGLIHKEQGEYLKFSHNEIEEMILANKLHPVLQDLSDRHQTDEISTEFMTKCQLK